MKIPATVTSLLARACQASWVVACVTLAGCAHVSVRQPSHELDLTSALDLPPGVTAPVAVRTVAPQFPWWRLREGLEGEASVICDIDATGVVLDAAVFSATCHDFGDAALAAVRQWRFAPGTRDGLPVRVRALVPIQFEFNSPLPKSLPGQVAQR